MAAQVWNPGDKVFYKDYRRWERGTVEKTEYKRHLSRSKPTPYVHIIPAGHECGTYCYHTRVINRRDKVRPAGDPEITAIIERKESWNRRRDEAEEALTHEYAEQLAAASSVEAVVAVLRELRPNLQISRATIDARIENEEPNHA